MKIKINNIQHTCVSGLTGAHLLGMLPHYSGEAFRGYQLQKINPDGIDTPVRDGDAVNDGDSFWAIPSCSMYGTADGDY